MIENTKDTVLYTLKISLIVIVYDFSKALEEMNTITGHNKHVNLSYLKYSVKS